MTITIDDAELYAAIGSIAQQAGESTEALVVHALREKFLPQASRQASPVRDFAGMRAAIRKIQDRTARLHILDGRTPEEIMGYNEHGSFD